MAIAPKDGIAMGTMISDPLPVDINTDIKAYLRSFFLRKQTSIIPVEMPVTSINKSAKFGVLSKVKNCNDSVKQAKRTSPAKTVKEYGKKKESVARAGNLAFN